MRNGAHMAIQYFSKAMDWILTGFVLKDTDDAQVRLAFGKNYHSPQWASMNFLCSINFFQKFPQLLPIFHFIVE